MCIIKKKTENSVFGDFLSVYAQKVLGNEAFIFFLKHGAPH